LAGALAVPLAGLLVAALAAEPFALPFAADFPPVAFALPFAGALAGRALFAGALFFVAPFAAVVFALPFAAGRAVLVALAAFAPAGAAFAVRPVPGAVADFFDAAFAAVWPVLAALFPPFEPPLAALLPPGWVVAPPWLSAGVAGAAGAPTAGASAVAASALFAAGLGGGGGFFRGRPLFRAERASASILSNSAWASAISSACERRRSRSAFSFSAW
jgi:hypothetical protein